MRPRVTRRGKKNPVPSLCGAMLAWTVFAAFAAAAAAAAVRGDENRMYQPERKLEAPFNFGETAFGTREFAMLGDAMPASDSTGIDVIRLTMAEMSSKGLLYNTVPVSRTFDLKEALGSSWHVVVDFVIPTTPRSQHPADGMGFFFSLNEPVIGDMLGMREDFVGLAVIIDTYRNSRRRSGKQPYVYAMINDGTVKYDDSSDGADVEITEGCNIDFDKRTRMLLTYKNELLSVWFSESPHHRFFTCFKTTVSLPRPAISYQRGRGIGYFALSAQTGHYFSQHDIYQFAVNVQVDMDSESSRSDAESDWESSETLKRRNAWRRPDSMSGAAQLRDEDNVGTNIGDTLAANAKGELNADTFTEGLSGVAAERLSALVRSINSVTARSAVLAAKTQKLSQDAQRAETAVEVINEAKTDLDRHAEKLDRMIQLLLDQIDQIQDFQTETLGALRTAEWSHPGVKNAAEQMRHAERRGSILFFAGAVLSQLAVGAIILYARAKHRQTALFA